MKKTLLFIAGSILLSSNFGFAQTQDVQTTNQAISAAGFGEYDLAATNLFRGTEYLLTPTTQVRPIFPIADLTNVWTSSTPGCSLAINIVDAGLQSVAFEFVNVGTIDVGETVTVSAINGYTPPAVIEDYEITAFGTSYIGADVNSSNDEAIASFSVTDTVFARENGNYTGAAMSFSGVEGKLCNKFELVNDDYVSSLSVHMKATSVVDTIAAEILVDNGGTPSTVVATSAESYASPTSDDFYTYPMVAGPVFLTAGTYHACITQNVATSLQLELSDTYVPEAGQAFLFGNWTFMEDAGFPNTLMIRMNMGNCEAEAGSLDAVASTVCLDNGTATLAAVTGSTPPTVPGGGYEILYVLTQGAGLDIVDASSDAEFTVTGAGEYTIHTLVHHPSTVNFSLLPPGSTANDINDLLIQGGGTVCGALDLAGAPITVDLCTGISDNFSADAIAIYPNPSNGQFVIEVDGVEGDAQITILDVTGREVYTTGVAMNDTFRKELNLDVSKGTYLVQIATVKGMVTRKIQID
ncbi:MAG: T9SS type A sorting domain-containing protein [Flavobacteriales bacterium]